MGDFWTQNQYFWICLLLYSSDFSEILPDNSHFKVVFINKTLFDVQEKCLYPK